MNVIEPGKNKARHQLFFTCKIMDCRKLKAVTIRD